MPTYSVLLAALLVCLMSGCTFSMPADPVRDAYVKSFDRSVPIFQRVLSVDRTRVTLSSTMASLGVDDNNSIKLKAALEKEFGVEFPEKLFLPKTHINDVVSYIALRVYKVDSTGDLINDNGPVSPDYFKKLEEEKREQEKEIEEGKIIPTEDAPNTNLDSPEAQPAAPAASTSTDAKPAPAAVPGTSPSKAVSP